MAKLKNNRAIAMLDKAAKEKYAIPAVVVYNLEGTLATIAAATALSSPAMLLFFPWALTTIPALIHTAHILSLSAPVPITLHLDHARTPALVRRAPDSRCFDSIMVDMSHHARDENLRLTPELAAYRHDRGIAVEAEPGRIEGGEDGVRDTADLDAVRTSPDKACAFAATGHRLARSGFR